MTKSLIFSGTLAILLLACSSTPPTTSGVSNADPIPLKDFFRNPKQGRFSVSPDGKHLAMMMPWHNRMNVFVQDLDTDRLPTGTPKQITFVKDRDLAGYFWKGDHTILYSRDFNGDENFHLFAVDLITGHERDLTPTPKTRAELLDDLEDVSDTDVLVQSNARNPELFDVYRLNVMTGASKPVAKNPDKFTGWGTDHAGVVRIGVESDGLKTVVYTRKTEKDAFKPIVSFDYKNSFSPLLFTPDNRDLYASSNLNRDKSAIVLVDPATGKVKKTIYEQNDVDVDNLSYSQKRKVITAASFVTWKQQFHFFDPIARDRYHKIEKLLHGNQTDDHTGDQIYYSSVDHDEDLFTVVATSDKTRGRYYLYDALKNRLTFLTDVSPWLDPSRLSDMKPIEYRSRDGLTIHGYLTIPRGKEAKNLPLVVNPHGGPWVRDEWGFNPEVQFLASRGYAVFQPNYRGSTGYGKKFFVRSFKQWGKKMQDDITDGVLWLEKQGIADPKRVAIYGGSYGGYATLAGITFTPDLYACAVDYVGVSNLFTFMNTIPPYWKADLTKLHAMVGDPAHDQALLRAASPVFHVDRIKAPLFVAQGAQDPRVNINESNQIVDSLKKRGVEVEYMVKPNEGHGFHNEENRFDFYGAMEKFLARYL